MKKLFLIIGIFTCIMGYGQTPVDQDSIDATQDPTNAMYGLVFDNTAKKIYHMTMEYYLPWKYVSPLLYPRSIATNVLAGATTNPYSDKWYVNGTSTISGNLYGMNRIYVGSARSSYLSTIAGQLYLTSPTSGTYSLAQLAAGGTGTGVDLTLVPNKSVILERADTAYGTDRLTFNDTTLTVKSITAYSMIIGESAGKDLTTGAANTFLGYNSGNSITTGNYNTFVGQFSGWYMITGSSNTAVGSNAAGGGSGAANTGNTAIGYEAGRNVNGNENIHIGYNAGSYVTGSGNIFIGKNAGYPGTGQSYTSQLFIDNEYQTKFNTLIWGDFANDSIRLNAKVHIEDSTYLDYMKPAASGTRFIVVTESAALDSGVLNPVSVGLTDPLWDIHKHLADRQNKEISWYHIDDKTGKLIKSYKLANNMNAFEQLQYTAEMSLRLIAEQDKRIALLERKEYRMNRQDYKYKAKLLKLENRLK